MRRTALRHPQQALNFGDRPGQTTIDADGTQRSVLMACPAPKGLRPAAQIVGRRCGICCGTSNRFQQRELCSDLLFQNKFSKNDTTICGVWEISCSGQSLPSKRNHGAATRMNARFHRATVAPYFLPYLPRQFSIYSCLNSALDMPLSA